MFFTHTAVLELLVCLRLHSKKQIKLPHSKFTGLGCQIPYLGSEVFDGPVARVVLQNIRRRAVLPDGVTQRAGCVRL